MKRNMMLLAFLVLLALALPLTAGAESTGSCGANVTWTLNGSGLLTISGTGDMNDYSWGEVPWDSNTESIQTVQIENGVTTIGDLAFYGCSNLTSVTIPDSVISIGISAFSFCSSLPSVTIPDSVISIGDYAFSTCSSLTSVTIPEGVSSIWDATFGGCSSLTSVTIPASVTTIQDYAFEGCSSLTDVYFTGSSEEWDAIYIGWGNAPLTNAAIHYNGEPEPEVIASGSCGNAVAWTLDDSGLLTISGTGTMDNYSRNGSPWYSNRGTITTVQIKNGVTSIGDFAFCGCSKLTSITIPESVVSIGNHAFNGCSNLTGVVLSNSLTSLGWRVFDNCTKLTTINIPAGLSQIDDQAFFEGSNLSSIQVSPESPYFCDVDGVLFDKNMTRIIRYPSGKTGIAYQIPDGIANIDSYAFYGCNSLTSITIPESVTSISYNAFSDCDNLAAIHVSPNNQKYCEVDGILFTESMSSIEHYPSAKSGSVYQIPDSVTRIGGSSFYGCANLTGIHIPESVTYIESNAFYSCTSLNNVTIPQGVTQIGGFTFQRCTGLTNITIPESVTSIGLSAFSLCSKLTDVNYTGSDEQWAAISIESGNNYLTNAEIHYNYVETEPEVIDSGSCGDNVTWTLNGSGLLTISGTGAMDDYDWGDAPWYNNRETIETVQIENGVTSIGECACCGCPNLTGVAIPSSVTSIGDSAFSGCSSLGSIQVESGSATYASVDGVLFDKDRTTLITCPRGKTGVYAIPDGVASIGDSAFSGSSGLISVTIPSSVTSIGEFAFSGCSNLGIIQVESGSATYASVDGVLFDKNQTTLIACPGGKTGEYAIPDGVTSIGFAAFFYCDKLTGVTISSGVTNIGFAAFSNCESLTSVTIPSSVIRIDEYAISDCSSLTDVYYTGSSEQWAAISWGEGNDLTNAQMHYNYSETEPAVIAIGSCGDQVTWKLDDSGLLTISGTGAMDNFGWGRCPWYSYRASITTVQIGNGVTNIGDHAFDGCTSMTSLILPASVTSIGESAFSGYLNLDNIQVESGNTAYSSIDGVLFDKAQTTLILCPQGKTGAYAIPSGVTCIGKNAFSACRGLTSITIPESVTGIGNAAFSECSSLPSITIPSSVASIGDYAFFSCGSLTSVTISEGVASIGDYAFGGCCTLPSITIPASVTSIGNSVFSGCLILTSIQVDSGSATYASVDGVLFNKAQTTLITCPRGKRGTYVIPSGVTSIGNAAFAVCNRLTSITIPASVTSIGNGVFDSCSSLTAIQVESGSTAYASVDGVLFDKAQTTLVACPEGKTGAYVIPSGVTSIGDYALRNCMRLTSVTIPASVTSIGGAAFSDCVSLKDVYYSGSSEEWDAISISWRNEYLTNAKIHYNYRVITNILTLPAALTAIESEAFAGLADVDAVSIPATVTSIADDAFDAGIVIITPAGSYAETWANDHGFTVSNP